jgi:CheY-like chemotaxis protein
MERRRARQVPVRPLVLLADGHDDTRELYAVSLNSLGFETTSIGHDENPFTRAWLTHPDIIVMELSLPGLDGWEFMRHLRADPRTRAIPIVIVTSDSRALARERAAREGCAAFFVKPCLPEPLACALREALDQSHPVDRRRPAGLDPKPCPRCGRALVFTSRYPELAVGLARRRAGSDVGERLRYERAWVCHTGGCEYRELLGDEG